MTLVGSVDLARGARLWSSADDSLAAAVRLDIGEVPAYGRVARVPLARVAAVPCGSEAGGARADVGCRCTERGGIWLDGSDGLELEFLLHDLRATGTGTG